MSEANKGINDPKFAAAKELLKKEGHVVSVNNLKKDLGIGDARAKAIMEALKPLIVHTPADDDLLGADSSEAPTSESSQESGGDSDNSGGVSVGSTSQEGLPPVTQEAPQEPTSSAQDAETLPPSSSPDSGAGSVVVDETIIGECPITGKPVRVCDQ